MDSTEEYDENRELNADEEMENKISETEEENQPCLLPFLKEEVIKGEYNDISTHELEEPEALESVHRYAKRIKSFLGWEPNLEEQMIQESGDIISEGFDKDVDDKDPHSKVKNGSPEEVNKNEDARSLDIKKEADNEQKLADDESVNDSQEDSEPELRTKQPEECDLAHSCPKSGGNVTEKEEINSGLNTIRANSSSLDSLREENLKTFPSDIYVPENQITHINPSNSTNPETELREIPDSDNTNSLPCLEDSNSVIELKNSNSAPVTEISVSPIDLENHDFPPVLENYSSLPVSENSSENVPGKNINDSPLNETKASDLEEPDSKELTHKETIDLDLEQDKSKEGDMLGEDYQFELMIDSEDVEQNVTTENDNCKLIESDSMTHLDENALFKNNVKNPYMDEVRRLSLGIVKDVIESARNSVHEIFTNNSGQETITENEGENYSSGNGINVTNDNKNLELENFEYTKNATNLSIPSDDFCKKYDTSESEISKNCSRSSLDSKDITLYEETVCGLGCFKPVWIQNYATPRVFLLFYCLVGITNGTFYTYIVSIMSTLEKKYAFESKVSGVILLADEITPLVLGMIVGYIGNKFHRPRMVAFGMFMSAACCFISALPYFTYGSAKHLIASQSKNVTSPQTCDAKTDELFCDSEDRPHTFTVVGIFFVANFLKGFASLFYYVIGFSYLDDITKKKNSALYFAIVLALRLLGPLVGFFMSSVFLKIYENPFDDPGFGPDDPRWIGAWWMGFFLQGILLVIFTLPIALFPRRLPSQKRLEKLPQAAKKESLKEMLADLFSALKRLGKNPVFILLIINTTMKIFGHFGHAIMLPKYVENQFRLSAADASLFSGASSIFCVMVSTVLGGFLIWKFRPRIKLLLAGMATSELVLSVGFLVLMIPRCSPVNMLNFGTNNEGLILDSACNQNCDCSTTSFTPFCGPDGKTTYFSPCYAGCSQEVSLLSASWREMEFGNCSCVSGPNSSDPLSGRITEGFCPDDDCWSKALAYLIILLVLLTLSNSLTVAHTMILLRSIHPRDKSIALGTFETFICLFGFIPFPVTFGALVDSACLVWEKSCGETGNCWFYDMDKYGYLLHGAAALFCSLSTLCLTILYFFSSRVRNLYVDEDEEEQIESIKLDTVSGSVTKL